MSAHELNELNPDYVAVPADEPGTELDIIVRRDLALRATDVIADVLEVDVSVDMLLALAEDDEPSQVRLAAKRALRCVAAIACADSAVITAVGEVDLYHYVEGVIEYGADDRRYLSLMENYDLTAEEATGLYALREQIAEESNGGKPGFDTLKDILVSVGFSMHEAAADTDAALAALHDAGYFRNTKSGYIYDRPIFAPGQSEEAYRLIEDDDDGAMTRGILAAIRTSLNRASLFPEETER